MPERVPYYPRHPLHDPLTPEEGRAQSLYRTLHKVFTEHSARDDRFRKALDRGEIIAAVYRGREGWPELCWRDPLNETDEHFRLERDIWACAVGMVSKEMRGLIRLITDLDKALADKDKVITDLNELYGSLLEMLQTLTRRRRFSKQQLEILSRLFIEGAIVERIEAFELRLSEFEAAQSRSPKPELPLPPPQPSQKGNLDVVEREA
jgi:hypothetical protein